MARIGLWAGIACYVGGLVTALGGLAVALDAVILPVPAVGAAGTLSGVATAAVLPSRLDPPFVRTADDRALLAGIFAGLGVGLPVPLTVLFLDAGFAVDTALVVGGLTTLLGLTLTWQASQRVWVDRRLADSEQVVDLGARTGDRWLRAAGGVALVSAIAVFVVAVLDRSYTTFVTLGYLGTLAMPSQMWPRREAVLAEGLLQHQHGAATLAEWDTFDSYAIEDEMLTLHERRSETTVDLSRADDAERVRSTVAEHLPTA